MDHELVRSKEITASSLAEVRIRNASPKSPARRPAEAPRARCASPACCPRVIGSDRISQPGTSCSIRSWGSSIAPVTWGDGRTRRGGSCARAGGQVEELGHLVKGNDHNISEGVPVIFFFVWGSICSTYTSLVILCPRTALFSFQKETSGRTQPDTDVTPLHRVECSSPQSHT